MQSTSPTKYGDEQSAKQAGSKLSAALKVQRCEFAVAPGCTLDVARGGRVVKLTAGAEVTLADLATGEDSPELIMDRLERRGIVLRASEEQLRAAATRPDAEFVVAEGSSLSFLRGILVPGEEVTADDVGGSPERLLELVSKGLVTHRPGPASASAPSATSRSKTPSSAA